MTDKLLIEPHEHVLLLTINRPKVKNAVDPETMDALREAVQQAESDKNIRVMVITGAGGSFCSGADIQATIQMGADADTVYRTLTECYGPTLLSIRNSRCPVIAAVDGYAAGIGCDLALRCDMRLLSERAIFAELFIRVGLIPDGGGTYLLPRLVGMGRALEMMMLGENVPAERAIELGLANRLLSGEDFMGQVMEFAQRMAAQSPLALERGKKAMLATLEGAATYAEALQREASYQREIFGSEDGFEGFQAFLEKRPPVWKGR